MVTTQFPPDFKEFLKLLHSHHVEYLLIGGYAVGYFGYPRATADIDIWIAVHPTNAQKMCTVLQAFGMSAPTLTPALFLETEKIIRMGVPPLRIEVLTSISGVSFADCYQRREAAMIDGIPITIINLEDLKRNKQASGRHKDLDDLDHL